MICNHLIHRTKIANIFLPFKPKKIDDSFFVNNETFLYENAKSEFTKSGCREEFLETLERVSGTLKRVSDKTWKDGVHKRMSIFEIAI